ncbi:MAG: hypothetical protein PGN16_06435 [Sphingomonas phyllosphaerae]
MGDFTVVPLVSQRILSVRIEGSLSIEDVRRLRDAQSSAIETVGWRARGYGLLVDISGSKIQDSAVASALDGLRTDPTIEPRHMAFVHGGAAAKMQVRRLASARGDAVFDVAAEAIAWLKGH